MKKIIVIVGPTAVGKTALSIQIAQALNGEIISGDSMQVYQTLDIGTAKATPEEQAGIKHYLLDTKKLMIPLPLLNGLVKPAKPLIPSVRRARYRLLSVGQDFILPHF